MYEAKPHPLAACHLRIAQLEKLLVDALLDREELRRRLGATEKDLGDAVRRQGAAERLAAVAAGKALAEKVRPEARARALAAAEALVELVEAHLRSGMPLPNPLRPQFSGWRELLAWVLHLPRHTDCSVVTTAEDLLHVLSVLNAGPTFPEMGAVREASEELYALRLVEQARDGAA